MKQHHNTHFMRGLPTAILLLLTTLAGSLTGVQAQVASTYVFAQSGGSYSEISGGTTLFGGFWFASFDDDVSSAQTIPPFLFDGVTYTEMYVSSNGFITFGLLVASLTEALRVIRLAQIAQETATGQK